LAAPKSFIDGIELGVSEKGGHINFINNTSDKDQITFGFHYFNGNISNLEYSLIKPAPILYSSNGLEFAYKRFITGSSSHSGLFTKFGLNISSLRGSSIIDLSSQIYDIDLLTITCRTCGKIKVKTENNSHNIIPSFSLGYQKQFSKKFSFNISAGLQYFDLPNVTWENSKSYNFPYYVHNKIDSVIRNSNKNLEKHGNIIPTIKLSTNFIF
tara:strand:- start:238 stop:873 length:636 start_codon:yes stop_codon:yes gene_type:complete